MPTSPRKADIPDTLSPMEKFLAELLQQIHADLLGELRVFRWQMLGLVVFLVAIVALLKGVDPNDAARVVPTIIDIAPVEEQDESFPATVPPAPPVELEGLRHLPSLSPPAAASEG